MSFIQLFGSAFEATAHFHARSHDGAFMAQFASSPAPRQSSLTLIELAMVLAVAAVVIGGVMLLCLSISNQRKITDTTALVVSAVQRISDLYEAKDFRGLDNQIAVAYGVLPADRQDADGEGYDLPIAGGKMTFGATDFASAPNLGITHVGPVASDVCITLGKLNMGEIVEYVVINMDADFVGASEADIAAHSVKDLYGEIPLAAVSGACVSDSYVHYYLTN